MKKFVLIAISGLFVFANCTKQADINRLIKARYVYSSCATAAVEVLDPTFYHLGSSWQRTPADTVYQHAFSVANQCSFKNSGIVVGEEFYFKLSSQNDKDCVICMLWDNPPAKRQIIEVIKKVN